jgi:hypothetical protein
MSFTTSDKDAAATIGDINKALIGESFGELVEGTVEYHANLPAASTATGRIYKVQKRTANYWTLGVTARFLAGYYESNGTVWKFKPNSALPVYDYDGSDHASTPNYRLFTPENITEIASSFALSNMGGVVNGGLTVKSDEGMLGPPVYLHNMIDLSTEVDYVFNVHSSGSGKAGFNIYLYEGVAYSMSIAGAVGNAAGSVGFTVSKGKAGASTGDVVSTIAIQVPDALGTFVQFAASETGWHNATMDVVMSGGGSTIQLPKNWTYVSSRSKIDRLTVDKDIELEDVHIKGKVTYLSSIMDCNGLTFQNVIMNGALGMYGTSNFTTNRVMTSNNFGKLAVSAITTTELDHLDNLTTNIKTKFDALDAAIALKEPTVSASNRIPVAHLDTGTVTEAEFKTLDGVTSSIQSQLNLRVDKSSTQTIGGAKTFSSKLSLHSAYASTGYAVSVSSYTWFGSGSSGIGYVAGPTASSFSFYGDSRIAGSTIWAHSDERIKENIENIDDALGILSQLRPASYNKIDRAQHGDDLEYGFIAQEVEKVIPAAITKSEGSIPILKGSDEFTFEEGVTYGLIVELNGEYTDITYATGEELPEGRVFVHNQKVDDFRVVDYNMLSSITAQAVKDLAAKVDDLQRQLDAK